jgi:hypothetical protein
MPLDFAKTVLQCGSPLPIHQARSHLCHQLFAVCAGWPVPEQAALHALQVFAQTVREKGPAGLFTGMGPRVTQTALMSAVFFSLFEWWKAQLKRYAACAQYSL